LENGELRLRLEDVLLRRAARRITRLGNTQNVLQQVLVLPGEADGRGGVVHLVVCLLQAGDHAQPHRQILLVFRAGLAGGDLAAQLLLTGERHLLRNHDAGVAGGRDA